jgi:hypothetical protein
MRAGAGASANWYHDKDADRSQIYQVHAAATAATLALSATVAVGTIRRLPRVYSRLVATTFLGPLKACRRPVLPPEFVGCANVLLAVGRALHSKSLLPTASALWCVPFHGTLEVLPVKEGYSGYSMEPGVGGQAFPDVMKAPWRSECAEIRMHDLEAKSITEFKKYAGPPPPFALHTPPPSLYPLPLPLERAHAPQRAHHHAYTPLRRTHTVQARAHAQTAAATAHANVTPWPNITHLFRARSVRIHACSHISISIRVPTHACIRMRAHACRQLSTGSAVPISVAHRRRRDRRGT